MNNAQVLIGIAAIATIKVNNKLYNVAVVVLYFLYFKIPMLAIFYFFIGIAICPLLFSAIFYLVYQRKLPKIPKLIVNIELFIYCLTEEIVWRDIISILIIPQYNIYIKMVLFLFFALCFTLMHNLNGGFKQFIEMFLFSILLYLTCDFFFGLHYGLHIGRNQILNRYDKEGILI